MPRLVEMGVIEARCQRRADLEGDDHIEHEEWLEIISEAYGELYSIVSDVARRYFERSSTLTTDGNSYVSEPSAHQSTIGLWYMPSTGRPYRLRELDPAQYDRWANRTGSYAERYEFIDDRLYLYPTPPTGQDYVMRYIPQAPDLSGFASDDCVDVVTAEGEAFLIWGAVVKAKSKSESDVRLAVIERDRMAEKVRDWAINRSMTEPRRMHVDFDDDDPADPAEWR